MCVVKAIQIKLTLFDLFFLLLPQALHTLRTAEFKPYVIFVKPRIHEGRRRRSASSPAAGEHGRLTVSLYARCFLQPFLVLLIPSFPSLGSVPVARCNGHNDMKHTEYTQSFI